MLVSLCWCQLRNIDHVSINIATSILGGWRWHGIWLIRWSLTRYWRSLQIWRCVMWRAVWLLMDQVHLRWIDDWVIQWRRHRYHRWWQLIALWVTVLAIKALVIIRSVLWRAEWLSTNRGQLRWIYDWIIQWMRHRYHQWWKITDVWVTALAIKAPFITRNISLPTLIVPCSTFVATTNTLWMWHDECNMRLWWCCVPVILFVDGQLKVRANFLARQLQSCLIFSTRKKLITSFLSQYHPNLALKYDLSEKGHYFMVHISYFITKIHKNLNI